MKVPPKPGHRSQGICHLPFVLEIDTKSILAGELIKDIERNGVVSVVEAISQLVCGGEFQSMLSFQVVNVFFENFIDIPGCISKSRERCHARIKYFLTIF